ncbi:MAG: D-2-hydroxyacid dehydrogenase [Planctomycetia bacterium]|nr:D-2-hydroxyacid dehydrogenase [Planctomycetia bacterium]
MKLVCFPPLDEARRQRVADVLTSSTFVNAATQDEAVTSIVEADAFFGKLTPPLLAAARQLRWVQSPTASLEHYVFDELVRHPCTLTNMRGIFSDVIADHVLGYILCFARNLHLYLRQQQAGRWQPIGGEQTRPDFAVGPGIVSSMDRAHLHLADCTLGIVGLGAIGEETARRAAAFGMRVVAVDPQRTARPDCVERLDSLNGLDALLATSDFVVVAAPHTPESVRMFERRRFQQMKPTSYFINIGRGAIVDLADLTAALEAGKIAGAALDVFEIEPLPAEHPLWRMPNVLLTPHVAACSPRIAERHLEVLLDNLRRFEADEPLRNVVDKKAWF